MYYHALIYQQIAQNLMNLYKISIALSSKAFCWMFRIYFLRTLSHWGLGETPQWIGRWTLQCPDGFRFGRKSQRSPGSHFEVPNFWDKMSKRPSNFSRHDVKRFSFCSFLFEGSGVALPLTWSLAWLHEKDLVDLFNIHNGRSFRSDAGTKWLMKIGIGM